jgi:hypothetical protein
MDDRSRPKSNNFLITMICSKIFLLLLRGVAASLIMVKARINGG